MPSKKVIEQVWEKADPIRGRDEDVWRRDDEGHVIRHGSYGTVGGYGWEIDHINPSGPDELWNLQPLFWRNNRRKSDNPPSILDLFGLLNWK